MKAVFVLSTGRTGTKFIADFFSEYEEGVVSLHEPRFSRHFRILSNKFVQGKASSSFLTKTFRQTRKQLFSNPSPCDIYMESNNFLYGYAPLFKELFSDYLIVHIVRDPRDYIRSHINHGVFRGNKMLAKQFVPYWFMNTRKLYGFEHKPGQFETLAARWVVVNKYLEEQSHGENYLQIRFEDVFKDGSGIEEICKKTGLTYHKERFDKMMGKKVNKGKLGLIEKWPNWENETCKTVYDICGEYMQKFGYGREEEWKKKCGITE